MANASEIYDFALRRGRPCQLPEPWSALPAHASCFHPPLDAAGLLAELQDGFSLAELEAAGMIVVDGEGLPALAAPWRDPTAVLFAARPSAKAPPSALVSDHDSPRHWALSAIYEDCSARELMDPHEPALFVVSSMADAAVLWALGFPAAPAQGLAGLRRPRLAEFCRMLGLRPPGQQTGRRGLVLVPWSPARLAPGDGQTMKAIGEHLGRLCRCLRLALPLRVWPLSQAKLDRLRFCAAHLAPDDVRAAAQQIYERTGEEFFDPRPPAPPPKPHAEALREWRQLYQEPTAAVERREGAWRRLQESQERELSAPLRRQAAETPDAVRRALLTQLAAVSPLCDSATAALAADFERALRERGYGAGGEPLPRDRLHETLALLDRMTSLCRQLAAGSSPRVDAATHRSRGQAD